MAYKAMKKIIEIENKLYETGNVTGEEYAQFKAVNSNKLDVFLATGRLTESQYKELAGLMY
jgi:hypothetical protein